MKEIVGYLPEKSVKYCMGLVSGTNVEIKIVNKRQSKHGDYKKTKNNKHFITINNSLNPYRFLITLIHEIAHLIAVEKYGIFIRPHGKEWKYTFKLLMAPLINLSVFPKETLYYVASHFKDPKASSENDIDLVRVLNTYNKKASENQIYVYQLSEAEHFKTSNGRVFKRGNKQIKRYLCQEIKTGKMYLFNPNLEVERI